MVNSNSNKPRIQNNMDKRPKEFQIRDLLEITDSNKYAATVAAFEIIENLEKLDLDPKKLGWKTNKVSVLAMLALARKYIKYDFITNEQRKQLEEELKQSSNIHIKRAEALFQKKKQTQESDEDLEEEDIGELLEDKFSYDESVEEDDSDDEYEESDDLTDEESEEDED